MTAVKQANAGRCGARIRSGACPCPALAEVPGRHGGYVYCACGHTQLVHAKVEVPA